MPQATDYYRFLDGALTVLIIDPDKELCASFYQPIFNQLPCCTVHYAHSLRSAIKDHLTTGQRFHVCITELGMGDDDYDELYVLTHYGTHCSVAVVTADTSPAKGAKCVQLGARGVFDKGPSFNWQRFYTTFCRMLLINVIYCRYNEQLGDTLTNATRILFEKNPATVTEWADHLRITDRQLRNLWHSGSGFGAKQMLFLYDCLYCALTYYGCVLFPDTTNVGVVDTLCKKKHSSYFKAHREVLHFILS